LEPFIDEETGLKKWPPLSTLNNIQRLTVLFSLCTFQLFNDEILISRVRDKGAAWRIEPLGKDKRGHSFWFLADCWLFEEGEEEEDWQCVAWDIPSWTRFLQENPFNNSRRGTDKALLKHLQGTIFSIAEPILIEEERRVKTLLKREQLELQRVALTESRKRSSRIAANERIRHVHELEEGTRSPKKEERRVMTREERVAMRSQKVAKIELEKVLAESRMDEDVEVGNESSELESEGEWEGEESFDMEELSEMEPFELNILPKSPIKLILKMGPDGPLKSELFIGDEQMEKNELGADSSALIGNPTPLNNVSVQSMTVVKDIIEPSALIVPLTSSTIPAPSTVPTPPLPTVPTPATEDTAAKLLAEFASAIQ
jgi:hypothetical protein